MKDSKKINQSLDGNSKLLLGNSSSVEPRILRFIEQRRSFYKYNRNIYQNVQRSFKLAGTRYSFTLLPFYHL